MSLFDVLCSGKEGKVPFFQVPMVTKVLTRGRNPVDERCGEMLSKKSGLRRVRSLPRNARILEGDAGWRERKTAGTFLNMMLSRTI